MSAPEEKVYPGKKVVIYSMLGFVLLTIVMGVGTYTCAKVLEPILSKRNQQGMEKYREQNAVQKTP
jgi:hypothetical protein